MADEERTNANVYVSPLVPQAFITQQRNLDKEEGIERIYEQLDAKEALRKVKEISHMPHSPFPRYDLAIISKTEELDQVIRPFPDIPISIVRARGKLNTVFNEKGQY